MCWLLVVVLAAVLVAVGQPHQLLLLLLAAVAAALAEEQNCGFLLLALVLLKQSLSELVVLEALLKQQMILLVIAGLTDQIHRLGLGHLPEVGLTVVVVQQLPERVELVAGVWGKVLQVQLNTAHLAALETQQPVEAVIAAVTDLGVAAELLGLQQA
jgi:hypothetical protein